MNVSGWHHEPAPPLSPLATRLVRWLQNTAPTPQESAEEVAARLGDGLSELFEARALALWLCLDSSSTLHLSHRAGEGADDVMAPGGVTFEAEAFPAQLFFALEGEGATRDLVAQLGLLSDHVAAPSLILPLGKLGLALFWLENEDGMLSDDWQPIFHAAGAQSAAWLEMATRAERLNRAFRQFAALISNAVDGREGGREGFGEAVAYYAGITARQMGLDEEEAQKIEFAALLHGIGRIAIPEEILQKQGALSPSELEQVRASTALGANWLATVDGLEEVALLVRHQGEKFDGSGVPAAFAGEEIPLGSRILAVAARFAAMTARRADRAPLSVVGGAMESVALEAGVTLDSQVVAAFLSAMGRSL